MGTRTSAAMTTPRWRTGTRPNRTSPSTFPPSSIAHHAPGDAVAAISSSVPDGRAHAVIEHFWLCGLGRPRWAVGIPGTPADTITRIYPPDLVALRALNVHHVGVRIKQVQAIPVRAVGTRKPSFPADVDRWVKSHQRIPPRVCEPVAPRQNATEPPLDRSWSLAYRLGLPKSTLV